MAEIDYSSDALNVLAKFYRSDVLVYVEGDDDVPFWRLIFQQVPDYNVAVEGLGGSEEIEKWIRRIETEGANVIVARDSDYKALNGPVSASEKVVYSFGYSIENSLYTQSAIAKISEICHRANAPPANDVAAWLDHFSSSVRGLVILDAAGQREGLGLAVMGDNCSRFMVSDRSARVCPTKSEARVAQMHSRVPAEAVSGVERRFGEIGGYSIAFIKGHFFASAVLKYIANHAGRSVSGETLFTNAVNLFERDIASNHPHRDYYVRSVRRALENAAA